MKVSTIAILAALGFSSMSSASGGYLSSCQNLSIEGLEGDPGRALLMRAECKDINGNYKKSVLDLNTCFGRGADCEISYPGTNLTGACNYCDNKWRHEARFGKRFSCTGPCDEVPADANGKKEYNAGIDLNEYIGQNNGSLTCVNHS